MLDIETSLVVTASPFVPDSLVQPQVTNGNPVPDDLAERPAALVSGQTQALVSQEATLSGLDVTSCCELHVKNFIDVGTTQTHLSLAFSMQYLRVYDCGCSDQMRLQSAINNYTIVICKTGLV